MNDRQLRVAIVGASGIGKNHARWFHRHGCDVCAFVGSSPEKLEATRAVLANGFGFSGQGYASVSEMLAEQAPEAVCISSPPPLHYEQAMLCMEAGAHVLCEKPLVFDPDKRLAELTGQARRLVETARDRGLVFGNQTQYAVAVPAILDLAGHRPGTPVRAFEMEMETKNLKHGRDYEAIWIDLSPHPFSVLQQLTGEAEIVPGSIDCQLGALQTAARFQVRRADGSIVDANVTVRFRANPDGGVPLRRFTIDGGHVDYVGRNNPQGEFVTYLTGADGREVELPDLVETLIGRFADACQGRGSVAVTGAQGAQNVLWQLQILEAAQRI